MIWKYVLVCKQANNSLLETLFKPRWWLDDKKWFRKHVKNTEKEQESKVDPHASRNYLSCRTDLLVTFYRRKYFKEKVFARWKENCSDCQVQDQFKVFLHKCSEMKDFGDFKKY